MAGYTTNKEIKHFSEEAGFWFIIGIVIQIITFLVFLRDLPRGMENYAIMPLVSGVISSLTNGFIHQCKMVGARTFFAISGLSLTYWILASLFDLI
tara:strand:- start:62 stop:349 length:288 start_codon:yes stop_codon:yes gene_type:complete